MNKYNISFQDYIDYLTHIRKLIFKILPLYEEGNEYLEEYIEDVIEDVVTVKPIINDFPYDEWYIQTLNNLKSLKQQVLLKNNHKKVKKRVLSAGALINRHINKLQNKGVS